MSFFTATAVPSVVWPGSTVYECEAAADWSQYSAILRSSHQATVTGPGRWPFRRWSELRQVSALPQLQSARWKPNTYGYHINSVLPMLGDATEHWVGDAITQTGRGIAMRQFAPNAPTLFERCAFSVSGVPGIDVVTAGSGRSVALAKSLPRADMAAETVCFPHAGDAIGPRLDSDGNEWQPCLNTAVLAAAVNAYLCEDGRICAPAAPFFAGGTGLSAHLGLNGPCLMDLSYVGDVNLIGASIYIGLGGVYSVGYHEIIEATGPGGILWTQDTPLASTTGITPGWPATWNAGATSWSVYYLYDDGADLFLNYFAFTDATGWGAGKIFPDAHTFGEYYLPGYMRVIGSL